MIHKSSLSDGARFRLNKEHVVTATIALGLLLLASNLSSLWILSAVRSYVSAESLWSKAQKNAVNSLLAFLHSKDPTDYQEYLNNLEIQRYDHLARLELGKNRPQFLMSDQFLINGGNHPNDVRMMGYLFRYGRNINDVRHSIELWDKGDQLFSQLRELGTAIHSKITTHSYNLREQKPLLQQIQTLNNDLTKVEKQFSTTLAMAARKLEILLLWLNVFVILTVCACVILLLQHLKKAKSTLAAEAKRYSLLANGVNQAAIVAVTDAHGDITYVNEKFCKISGYNANELIGKNHRIINSGVHPKEFFSTMWQTIKKGNVWTNEVCNKRKDGSHYWVDSTIVPTTNTDGSKQYLSIRFEITERKRIEQQLLESSKMMSLGVMAAGVAHEINNPLAVVDGKIHKLARLLEKSKIDPAEVEEFHDIFNKIQLSISRIAKIVNGLKVFSRNAENDPFIEYNLSKIIDETLSLCSERFKAHGIDLKIHPTPEIKLMCNPTQLSQVILNLLNNSHDAIEFLPEKWIELKASEFDDSIKISITDSGSGISTEIITRIMEPFFTTKTFGKGTGLGLSISKGIIENHQGRLRYEQGTKNTCFTIELPKKTQ